MALINIIIGPQNFELVHNRIGEIITEELNNQFLLTYDEDLDVTVFKERHVPFSHAELPAVNVLLWKGEYAHQTQTEVQGLYRYIIECTGQAPSEDGHSINTSRGDTLSMSRIQRLMGVIRAIIENPKYNKLGFPAPSLGYRRIEDFMFMKTINQDAVNVVIGRLILVVQVNETTELINPILIGGNDTVVKLALTDFGYQWTLDED